MATTWNPADRTNYTLSNGNLTGTPTGAAGGGVRSILSVASGKYYFEYTVGSSGTITQTALGISNGSANLAAVGGSGTSAAIVNGAGTIAINGSVPGSGLAALAANNVVGIAVDVGAALVWFRIAPSGNWNGSGTANPASGAGGYSFSTLTGGTSLIYALICSNTSSAAFVTANFGDSAFSGAVPSGFNAGFPGGAAAGAAMARVMVLG